MAKQKRLVLPVVSLSAEYLVMGNLMRRNILVSFKSVYISFFARKLGNILDH